jgi:hypothetical protein
MSQLDSPSDWPVREVGASLPRVSLITLPTCLDQLLPGPEDGTWLYRHSRHDNQIRDALRW